MERVFSIAGILIDPSMSAWWEKLGFYNSFDQ
jgi:hypothetical protein